jgi:hypothetical protein
LSHLRSRGAAFRFVALVSIGCVLVSAPPPEPTLDGLGAFLGARAGVNVETASIAWEPRRNALVEVALGRRVLFLASPVGGGPRDVYRATVRLTPSGQPIAISSLTNLADTAFADELGLSLEENVATFVTAAFGKVQAVTALEVGRSRLERTDVFLLVPAREATLGRDGRSLTLRLDSHAEELRYDFDRRALTGESPAARVVRRAPPSANIVTRLADRARRSLGDGLSSALGTAFFRTRDGFVRAAYAIAHVGRRPEPRETEARAHVEDARNVRRPQDVWPPPKVPSRFAALEPDEGAFRPLVTRGSEPALYRTFVRPDPLRPYSRAIVVAMDMRQLELGIVSGTEIPKPNAGPPGEGRLTGNRSALGRVVAVVSGGRTERGGRFGMQAGGRLLVPPEPGKTAIVELALGETRIGPWPFGSDVPEDVVGFRQGLDTLLDANGRPRVESIGPAFDVRSRSGLGVTPAGHLYYAFGERLDQQALASTFSQAGCAVAVELGGGLEPAGMALAQVTSPDAGRFTTVDEAMSFDAESVLAGSSRDFFTVSLRVMKPRLPTGAVWQPDPGTQPLPSSITGIFRTSVPLGGLTVELVAFESGRVEWRLRPGVREPGAKGEAWAGVLPEGDAERALATVELGHTTVTPRLGLALGTKTPITMKDAFATLVLAPTEPPRIFAPGETPTLRADEQAVQLPFLADADGVTERARERGALRVRSALGVTRSGRTLVALLRHDSSDPLAVALKNAGAERVVELDRGSHHPAFVHRTGTPTPPEPNYDSTTLWALGRPMLPGARIAK